MLVAQIWVVVDEKSMTPPSAKTGITGCYTANKRNSIHSVFGVLAAVNEIQGLGYTAYAAYRFFLSGGLRSSLNLTARANAMRIRSAGELRSSSGTEPEPVLDSPYRFQSPLVSALVQHNVFYYACALAFTATAAVLMAKYPVIYSVTFSK